MSYFTSVTRRAFLQHTTLAAGALAVFPAILPAGARGANDRVTVGCIGVGDRGTYLLQTLLELPEAQVIAVCDVKRDRRESAQALVNKTYENQACVALNEFEAVLSREDIDACVIASCDHWHVYHAVEAVQAGKDIYLEKPMGLSIEQDQILRQVVREKKRVFQFGTQQRSDRRFRQACEMALNGVIGDLQTIKVWAPPSIAGGYLDEVPVPETLDYDRWLGPAPKVPYTRERESNKWWWFNSDYSVGFISAWGIHPLDIALWGAGERCHTNFSIEGAGVYPTQGFCNTAIEWNLQCEYDSGLTIDYRHDPIPDQWKERYGEVTGHGTAFEGSEGWVHVDRNHIRSEPANLVDIPLPSDAFRLPESPHHMKNFIECVRSRKDPVSDIESAVQGDILCQVSDIALRLGRKLRWNFAAERFEEDDEANARLHVAMREPWQL